MFYHPWPLVKCDPSSQHVQVDYVPDTVPPEKVADPGRRTWQVPKREV